MDAIWEKHGDLIATGGDREKHIRKTHLNENPRCLGGRAIGKEGQSGNNNFGEKKNHDQEHQGIREEQSGIYHGSMCVRSSS